MTDFFWHGLLSQKEGTDVVFNAYFAHLKATERHLARVVELGTGTGDFTIWLAEHEFIRACGAPIMTYDQEVAERLAGLQARGISCVVGDLFAYEAEIGRMVSSPGLSLLICDDGDKIREVNTFSHYLKVGDLIMAHDWCSSHEEYNRTPIWTACEITAADIAETVRTCRLMPFVQDAMAAVAWMSKIRVR